MKSVLVVLRGGPFDGRELSVSNWPAPLMVESMPKDPHAEARVRAQYLARDPEKWQPEPREMFWDEAQRVGGIHHG